MPNIHCGSVKKIKGITEEKNPSKVYRNNSSTIVLKNCQMNLQVRLNSSNECAKRKILQQNSK